MFLNYFLISISKLRNFLSIINIPILRCQFLHWITNWTPLSFPFKSTPPSPCPLKNKKVSIYYHHYQELRRTLQFYKCGTMRFLFLTHVSYSPQAWNLKSSQLFGWCGERTFTTGCPPYARSGYLTGDFRKLWPRCAFNFSIYQIPSGSVTSDT